MSARILQEIACPCGEDFEAELWNAVNAAQEPELKEEILAGQLNVVACPVCKSMVYAERFVLYHDPAAELMAFVYPLDYEKDADNFRSKTREDFAAAQNLIEKNERLTYPPISLFGMDALVELLMKEQEEHDQSIIVEAMAEPMDIKTRRLPLSLARNRSLPPVLPLAGPADDELTVRFRRGLDRILGSNDRLTIYAAVRERFDSLNLSGLWEQ